MTSGRLDSIRGGTLSIRLPSARHLTAQVKSAPLRPTHTGSPLRRGPWSPSKPVCRRVANSPAPGRRRRRAHRVEGSLSLGRPPTPGRTHRGEGRRSDHGAPHERRRHVDVLEPGPVHAARGRARRHRVASAYLPALPAVVLAHEEAGSTKVGVVHDQCGSGRLRETTEFPPAVRLAHATARRGGDELAEQTDVHLESIPHPKDAGESKN